MQRYNLAIHGFGLLPGLLAVQLMGRHPGQTLLLLSGDKSVGGEILEPVLTSGLSEPVRALVERFAVAAWPGYFITRDGQTEHRDGEVLLLDPVQLWLELDNLLPPGAMDSTGGKFSIDDERIDWNGGTALADQVIDLAPITWREQSAEIIGLDAVRSLPFPVLADLDTGDEPWDALQHIPLGDERVFVRKCNCRDDPMAELTTGFASTLSDLLAF